MSTCTLIQKGANETYNPNPFENTGNIKFYHNNVPRFGNTNEILQLLQGTSDEQHEYIQGLLASPITLAMAIMTWIIILGVFTCCRCGFCRDHDWLAGKPVPLPKEPDSKADDDSYGDDENDVPSVELTVFKGDPGFQTGVKLGLNRQGDIIALRVDEKGLFFGKLQVGQRIISILGCVPEDHFDDEDNGVISTSKGKEIMQKMKDETKYLVGVIKQKTKGYGKLANSGNNSSKDKVSEAAKRLDDSVGKLTIVALGRVLKEDVMYAEWKNEYDRVFRQKTIFKSIVAFALFVLFTTGVVLCSDGVNGIESAIDTGVETLDIVEGRMRQGVEFLDDVLRLKNLISNDVKSLLTSLNGICPSRTAQICSDLNDPSSCQSISGLNIVSEMQQAISYIQEDATTEQVVQDARTTLEEIAAQTANVDADLDPVNRLLAATLAFGVIVSLISIFLLLVLFIPMPGIARSVIFFFSYGLLFVIIFFSFLLLLVVLPVSSAVGDVCYDDPGSRIEKILRDTTYGWDQLQDMVFNIFKGCSAPEVRLDDSIDYQADGIGVFGSFDSAIAQLKQNSVVCGTPPSEIATVETALNEGVNVHLCEAFNVLSEFSEFFTCRFWHPIYVQAAHESLCYEGMDALSAITNTLFFILCMSLLTMTFRVALWDALRPPAQDDETPDMPVKSKDVIMKSRNEDKGNDLETGEHLIQKKKKKKKHISTDRTVEEWNDEEGGTKPRSQKKKKKKKHVSTDRTVEDWNDEEGGTKPRSQKKKKKKRLDNQGFDGEGPVDPDGELPKKKTKKVPKKKKKKPLHREGDVEADAVVSKSQMVEVQGTDSNPQHLRGESKLLKKKKKKKNIRDEDVDGTGDAVPANPVV